MKKLINILLITISTFVFNNCTNDGIETKDLNYVSFESITPTVTVDKNSSTEREIKIYTTQISSASRTININVALGSTTAAAGSYVVPSSVTIPANTNVGSFILKVSDINIPPAGVKIVLAFTPESGLFTGDNKTINVLKVCSFNINDFIGAYNITEAGYGTYPSTITKDPSVANRIWVSNFWDWTNDLAYYDFNPTNGTVTMPSQVIVMGDGGHYTCFGSGTYNACAGTFHMTYGGDVAGTIHDFNPAN